MSIFVGRQKNQMWALVMFKKFDFYLSQVFTIYSFIFWPKKENRKSDFWPFYFFGHFPIEIPIEAEIIFVGGLPIELERKQKLF